MNHWLHSKGMLSHSGYLSKDNAQRGLEDWMIQYDLEEEDITHSVVEEDKDWGRKGYWKFTLMWERKV